MKKKRKCPSTKYLVSCPCCDAKVNKRKLGEHVLRVHQISIETLIFNKSVYEEIEYLFITIDEWLYKYMHNCYSRYEVDCLKIMFAEEVLKHKLNTIKNYLAYNWSEDEYRKESLKLRNSFQRIKHDITDLFKFNNINEHDVVREVNWEECNSYEKMFGKKYIGYLRRENNNSKFGSYPLHDDYSEDSNPDEFTY